MLDAHLGRLATYLRMLGFDSAYSNQCEDAELARISHDEQRILLTRDNGLLKRSTVIHAYFVRAKEPETQLREVVKRFGLASAASPFRRCLACNAALLPVTRNEAIEQLEPKTRQYYDDFQICPMCRRIYWAGSHYQRMRRFVQEILAANEPEMA